MPSPCHQGIHLWPGLHLNHLGVDCHTHRIQVLALEQPAKEDAIITWPLTVTICWRDQASLTCRLCAVESRCSTANYTVPRQSCDVVHIAATNAYATLVTSVA